MSEEPAMLQMTLDEDELMILRSTLAAAIADLGMEIADTDNPEYRRRLRQRRQRMCHMKMRLDVLGLPLVA